MVASGDWWCALNGHIFICRLTAVESFQWNASRAAPLKPMPTLKMGKRWGKKPPSLVHFVTFYRRRWCATSQWFILRHFCEMHQRHKTVTMETVALSWWKTVKHCHHHCFHSEMRLRHIWCRIFSDKMASCCLSHDVNGVACRTPYRIAGNGVSRPASELANERTNEQASE